MECRDMSENQPEPVVTRETLTRPSATSPYQPEDVVSMETILREMREMEQEAKK
jgi:hypothetical protein